MAKAGIEWDSTLGYADVAGFRLGVCHPIPLFDPVRMQPLGIQEHPLIVMDCTLTRPNYMSLTPEAALDCCSRLLATTRRHHAQFIFLLHNTALARGRGKEGTPRLPSERGATSLDRRRRKGAPGAPHSTSGAATDGT